MVRNNRAYVAMCCKNSCKSTNTSCVYTHTYTHPHTVKVKGKHFRNTHTHTRSHTHTHTGEEVNTKLPVASSGCSHTECMEHKLTG